MTTTGPTPFEEIFRQEQTLEHFRRAIVDDVAGHGATTCRQIWDDNPEQFYDSFLTEITALLCEVCTQLGLGESQGLAVMQRALNMRASYERERVEREGIE